MDGFYRRDGERRPSRILDSRFKPIGGHIRRSRTTNGVSTLRGDEESACAHKLGDPQLPRKAPVELTADATVPQTDTGEKFLK